MDSTYLMNDMHLKNKDKFNSFYDNMITGTQQSIDSAQEILSQNTDMNNQIMNAENVNLLKQGVLDQENGVKENIDNKLDELLQEFQSYINNMIVKGQWSATVQYEQNNLVYYDKGEGESFAYFAYTDQAIPIGTLPTDTNYWIEFDIRGLQGYGGIGYFKPIEALGNTIPFRLKYNYDNEMIYTMGDVVVYESKMWVCVVAQTQGKAPNIEHFPWTPIMLCLPPVVTPVQIEEPEDLSEGDFWWKIYDGRDLLTAWTFGVTESRPSYAQAVYAIGTNLYSVGGEGANFIPTKDNDCYDTLTRTWSAKADTPIAVAGVRFGVNYKDKGFLAGIQTYDYTTGVRTYTDSVLIYDPVANSWSYDTAKFPKQSLCSLCADENSVYAVGLNDNDNLLPECYKYTDGAWSAIADIPLPCTGTAPVCLNGKIYVAGGTTSMIGFGQPTDRMQVYDIATNTWSEGTKMLEVSAYGATFIHPDKNAFYYLGGYDTLGSSTTKVYKYDLTTDKWINISRLLISRMSFGAATIGQTGYAVGGLNFQKITVVPQMEEYNFELAVPNLELEIEVNANTEFKFPLLSGGTYNFYVDWGDRTKSGQITSYDSTEAKHTYLVTGTYTLKLYGTCSRFSFDSLTSGDTSGQYVKKVNYCDLEFDDLANTFALCPNLQYVYPKMLYNSPNVTTVEGMFIGCTAFTKLPENFFVNNNKITNVSLLFNESGITSVPWDILRPIKSITNINSLFYYEQSIKEIPSGLLLEDMDIENINNLFAYCINLEKIGSLNMRNVTSTTDCFKECNALKDLEGFPRLSVSFDLSDSTLLTEQSIINVLNSLGQTYNQTATFGATNLAKLTSQEGIQARQNAIAKGWILA